MKKTIRPISILRIAWLSIWLFFIGLSVTGIVLIFVEQQYDALYILGLILAIPILLISLFIFFADFRRGVLFYTDGLKVRADIADKRGVLIRRLQHNLDVKYEEIRNLYAEYSRNDSKGRPVKNVFRDMPYVIIELKDGSKRAINVDYYNKMQKAQIIDEIKLRAEKGGNPIDCPTGKEIWN